MWWWHRKGNLPGYAFIAAWVVIGIARPLQAEVVRRFIPPDTDSLQIVERPIIRGSESVVQGADTLTAGLHYSISPESQWLVLDFIDVIVHAFHRDKRDVYALEDLWSDAPRIEFESSYPKGITEEVES